jgi:hypothetical protein
VFKGEGLKPVAFFKLSMGQLQTEFNVHRGPTASRTSSA